MNADKSAWKNKNQPDELPIPEFVKQLQQAAESYAKAVNADKTEEAEQAALAALIMAAAEAEPAKAAPKVPSSVRSNQQE